jgi:FKBP-type peptidyl-prolyl cis-trans isomerase 2
MTLTKYSFHFLLKDLDGNLIDSSYDSNQPVSFTNGQKELFPSILERKITSMQVGKTNTFEFTPTEAFGLRDESRVIVIPISEIRLSHEGQNIERGQKVLLHTPDSNYDEDEISFTVTSVMNGMVALDGNHPLAGIALSYEIELIESKEIIED